MARRSVRLAARNQSTRPDSHSNLLTSSDEVNEGGGPYGATDDEDDPDHLWCFCQQPTDGKFMIMCDHQGENCFRWYHGACVDVSSAEGNLMSETGEPFVCSMCSSSPTLPSYTPTNPPNFLWGSSVEGKEFCERITSAYDIVVHWRQNLFMVPFGSAGKEFVIELSKLFDNYGSASALEGISLKAAMVMPALLLQRPHFNSKSRDHINSLHRRLKLWHDGDIQTLVNEGIIIQQRIQKFHGASSSTTSDTSRFFARLMFQGKVKAALRYMSNHSRGSFLPLSSKIGESTVFNKLMRKHPPPSTDIPLVASDTPLESCHPIIFESLDDVVIRKAVLCTKGSAGPSGMDAQGWRSLCTSFKNASDDLCRSLASVARRISTTSLALQPFLNNRLIALDKNPGVCPIGVGETVRRILAKAILSILRQDILNASGCLQLCAGQWGGCEAAVHAMRGLFNRKDTDGILLVDASNAFNSLT